MSETDPRWEGTRRAWGEVGERFADLGRLVREQRREHGDDPGQAPQEPGRGPSEAVRRVVEQLDQTFTSLGEAIRQPEAKQGLQRAARSLGEALEATFSELADGLKRQPGPDASDPASGRPDAPDGSTDTTGKT